ncbi:MAG: hypothetical protein KBS35_00115 [Mycoplasma sp.]|nr:hypothetical protein [Candidatus Hennigella equi]
MKKILIPTLLTVASTPLISLVGCGTKQTQFELTEYYSYEYETGNPTVKGLRTKQPVDLNKTTTYTALIDLNNFPVSNLPSCDLSFYVATDVVLTEATFATILTATVSVDNTPLTQVYTDRPETGEYDIYVSGNRTRVRIGLGTLTSKSQVQINFTIRESVEQYYLFSHILHVLTPSEHN